MTERVSVYREEVNIFIMDDQTNNPGGTPPSDPTTAPAPSEPVTPAESVPVQSEPAVPSAEPAAPVAAEEKCVTCGGPASSGTCSACNQGELSCTCQPAGGPSTPSSEPGGSAPMA